MTGLRRLKLGLGDLPKQLLTGRKLSAVGDFRHHRLSLRHRSLRCDHRGPEPRGVLPGRGGRRRKRPDPLRCGGQAGSGRDGLTGLRQGRTAPPRLQGLQTEIDVRNQFVEARGHGVDLEPGFFQPSRQCADFAFQFLDAQLQARRGLSALRAGALQGVHGLRGRLGAGENGALQVGDIPAQTFHLLTDGAVILCGGRGGDTQSGDKRCGKDTMAAARERGFLRGLEKHVHSKRVTARPPACGSACQAI